MKKIETYFLTRYTQEDYLNFNQAKLVLYFCLTTAVFSALYTVTANLIAFRISGIIMPIAAVLFIGLAFLLKSFIGHKTVAQLYLTLSFIPALILIKASGGIYSSILPWLAYIPLAANLMLNRKSAWIWLALCLLSVVFFAVNQDQISNIETSYNKQWEIPFVAIVYSGLFVIILLLSMISQHAKDEIQQLLKNKNAEISDIYIELKDKQNEIIIQNNKLQKQKEEISEQRDFIESKNKELVKIHWQLEKTIQKLQKTQAILSEKEAASDSILEAIYHNHLLAEFDLEGNFIFISDSFENVMNLKREDVISHNIRSIGDAVQLKGFESIDIFMTEMWPRIVAGETVHNESKFNFPNKKIWTRDTFFCVKDAKDKAQTIIVIAQDISTIKEQQIEIVQLNEKLSTNILKIAKQNTKLQQQQLEIEEINKALENQKDVVIKMNQHLEERVATRTQDLAERNKQLAEYAFINSHLLRGPLCSILGLVQLLEIEPNEHTDDEIMNHLKKSTSELNLVVQKISKAIMKKDNINRNALEDNLN